MTKFIAIESRGGVARSREDGVLGLLFPGYRISVCKRKEFWRLLAVRVAQECEYTGTTEPYASKWLRWYILSSCMWPQFKKQKKSS